MQNAVKLRTRCAGVSLFLLGGHMAATSEAHPSRTATKNLSRVMPSPSLAPSKETVNVERRRGGADRLTEIGRASDTPFLIHPTFPRILDAALPHLKLGYNLSGNRVDLPEYKNLLA